MSKYNSMKLLYRKPIKIYKNYKNKKKLRRM